jgi:hypothetical protein
VNNARIPGRAIVVVYLALAILAAWGFLSLWRTQRRVLAGALAVLALADIVPLRPELYTIERPRLYEILKTHPPGAVCELPFGLRDGFGQVGRFDERVLLFQTRHERPLVGGFQARLPATLVPKYESLPVIGTLLSLSGGAALPPARPSPEEAGRVLADLGIRYVIVNRSTSPPALLQYVTDVLPLDRIAIEGDRMLFAVR